MCWSRLAGVGLDRFFASLSRASGLGNLTRVGHTHRVTLPVRACALLDFHICMLLLLAKKDVELLEMVQTLAK